MKNSLQGFTLIELMIVVAIIGLLSAIALPIYQSFVAKSQATSGLATLSALKTVVEDLYTSGSTPTGITDLGISSSANPLGTLSGTFAGSGAAILTFTFDGNVVPAIQNGSHTLTRTGVGVWTCTTTVAADYRPKGCPL